MSPMNLNTLGQARAAAQSSQAPDMQSYFSLHNAARQLDAEMVKALLESGVDADIRDPQGNTPLMTAVSEGMNPKSRKVSSLLIIHGADVDAVNNAGKSVLMSSVNPTTPPALDMLFSLGAKMHNPKANQPLAAWCEKNAIVPESVNGILKGRENIPLIDPAKIADKSELFKPNEQGYVPLDDPENWKRLPQISEALQQKGQPLCKADFQVPLRNNNDGMVCAVECGSYQVLSDVLRKVGDPIKGGDFIDSSGMPNILGQRAVMMWLGSAVFTQVDHWKESSVKEISTFRKELPQGLRDQFDNYHQLIEARRQQEAVPEKSRGR